MLLQADEPECHLGEIVLTQAVATTAEIVQRCFPTAQQIRHAGQWRGGCAFLQGFDHLSKQDGVRHVGHGVGHLQQRYQGVELRAVMRWRERLCAAGRR